MGVLPIRPKPLWRHHKPKYGATDRPIHQRPDPAGNVTVRREGWRLVLEGADPPACGWIGELGSVRRRLRLLLAGPLLCGKESAAGRHAPLPVPLGRDVDHLLRSVLCLPTDGLRAGSDPGPKADRISEGNFLHAGWRIRHHPERVGQVTPTRPRQGPAVIRRLCAADE